MDNPPPPRLRRLPLQSNNLKNSLYRPNPSPFHRPSLLTPPECSDTEIDWQAYMQQVALFLAGERDYTLLKGGTGPLVYPAAHVYIYSALYYVTDEGRDIRRAQLIFAGVYLGTLGAVMGVYRNAKVSVKRPRLGGGVSFPKENLRIWGLWGSRLMLMVLLVRAGTAVYLPALGPFEEVA